MIEKPEILAPAGSFESVVSAVRCGANAVYLGTKQFNARRNAENFDFDELKKTVEYCHARGVRVHVTLNTLVSDEEFDDAIEVVKESCLAGVDALIIQDLGLSYWVSQCSKELERHASTQMSVQTLAGVKLLSSMGFCRVVLPRELSKDEIEQIRKGTEAELEVFIHGAQCMSVSGQCYMSAMLGSRSGNRGLCAQPCRLQFSAPNSTGYDLSLKDLSLIEHVKELADLGINSFKIEGRMKRPEYVAAAVSSAKKALNGESSQAMLQKLKAVFSRSGFTDGYFMNKRCSEMFGTRTKSDVVAASGKVLSELSHLYDKEQPLVAVEFYLTVIEGESISLSASANGKTVFVSEQIIPEKAINKPTTKESLKERLSKCGSTMFYAGKIEIELDEGLIVPASAINSLRRTALQRLENELSSVKQKDFTDEKYKAYKNSISSMATAEKKEPKFSLILSNGSQIPHDLTNVENLYFPLEIEEKYVENVKNRGINVGIDLPRGIFGKESYVENLLLRAKGMGITVAHCNTLDTVAIAKKCGMEIHTGFSMNVYNSQSAAVLEGFDVKAITLSPELTVEKCNTIKSRAKLGLVAYGRLPLMLTRNCPVRNSLTCDKCKGKSFLTDRLGLKFPVNCKNGCSEIFNAKTLYMGDRLSEIKNADFISFIFTRESKENVDAVLNAYRLGKKAKGDFTRGLYYRSVQ